MHHRSRPQYENSCTNVGELNECCFKPEHELDSRYRTESWGDARWHAYRSFQLQPQGRTDVEFFFMDTVPFVTSYKVRETGAGRAGLASTEGVVWCGQVGDGWQRGVERWRPAVTPVCISHSASCQLPFGASAMRWCHLRRAPCGTLGAGTLASTTRAGG